MYITKDSQVYNLVWISATLLRKNYTSSNQVLEVPRYDAQWQQKQLGSFFLLFHPWLFGFILGLLPCEHKMIATVPCISSSEKHIQRRKKVDWAGKEAFI